MKNNNKLNQWIILLVLCNLFLFTACSTDTKNNQEAAVIANTVIARITEKAQSASTPTDKSIATPNATSTPESQTVDDSFVQNIEYLTIEEEKISNCSTAIDTMTASFLEIVDNADLLFDQTHIDKVNSEIDDYVTYCTSMGQKDPPTAMKVVNDYLLLANQENKKAADYIRDGFNNLDGNSLDNATNHLSMGTSYIGLARDELNSIWESLPSE